MGKTFISSLLLVFGFRGGKSALSRKGERAAQTSRLLGSAAFGVFSFLGLYFSSGIFWASKHHVLTTIQSLSLLLTSKTMDISSLLTNIFTPLPPKIYKCTSTGNSFISLSQIHLACLSVHGLCVYLAWKYPLAIGALYISNSRLPSSTMGRKQGLLFGHVLKNS